MRTDTITIESDRPRNMTVTNPSRSLSTLTDDNGAIRPDGNRMRDETDQEVRNDQDTKTRERPDSTEKRKPDDGAEDAQDNEKKGKKSRTPFIILAVVTVAAIVGGVLYWLSTRNLESTDDAYTEGNAVSIAPKVSGYVIDRRVDDNTFVKAGDLMIQIDPRDYITARDQAQGNLHLAEAQLASARINLEIVRVSAPANLVQARAQLQEARANQANAAQTYQRQHSVDPRATTQTNTDQANAQFRSSNASVNSSQAQLQTAGLVTQNIQSAEETVKQQEGQVEEMKAALAQAELNLSYTQIRAPEDGYVTQRNVDRGTYAQAGQQIFYLVTTDWWVVANFKETQLADMRPNQPVNIGVDAYPQIKLHGHVQSIQEGSGSRFTAFPAENATGNYVKIVQRVPVKIIIDHDGATPPPQLPLGLSVNPVVTVR